MVVTLIQLSWLLSRKDLEAALYNFLLFGDCPLLKVRNRLGKMTRLPTLSSVWTRAKNSCDFAYLQRSGEHFTYQKEDVIFIKQYAPYQQIYGVPDYMKSAQLNTNATLFRRKYYKNGAHCGFIFYAIDPNLEANKEELLKAIAGS